MDVYAFAMVVLELVTLKLPFEGRKDFQIFYGVPNGERPEIPSNCDTFLRDLMIECWQGEPSKRPQFLQILERLKYKKGESMWPTQYPNLLKLSNQFPHIGKLPKSSSDIIVERMNLGGRLNDWQTFITLCWPTYSTDAVEIKFKDKMQSVLNQLVSEGESTAKLFDLLEKLKRKDVLDDLEEYCR